jgi:hypothetical protein
VLGYRLKGDALCLCVKISSPTASEKRQRSCATVEQSTETVENHVENRFSADPKCPLDFIFL